MEDFQGIGCMSVHEQLRKWRAAPWRLLLLVLKLSKFISSAECNVPSLLYFETREDKHVSIPVFPSLSSEITGRPGTPSQSP